MIPAAQRVAMAELEGWQWLFVTRQDGTTFIQFVSGADVESCLRVCEGHGKVVPRPVDVGTEWENAPYYLTDLNEVHRARAVLTAPQRRAYVSHILAFGRTQFDAYNTSAAQQTEAVLRATNRWRDDQ